ncbi:MAG: PEP/pyruvate-binding domain-containing protein [Syntrophobacteraceae bacterium]|nr:hypothetical protein [Desulfobacteraceae bacterium]
MDDTPPTASEPRGADKDPPRIVTTLVSSIAAEFEVAMGSPDRVQAKCEAIKECLGPQFSDLECSRIVPLFSLLARRTGRITAPVFELLFHLSGIAREPWPILEGMLSARDEDLVRRALKQALDLARNGRFEFDLSAAYFLAERSETEGSPLNQPDHLAMMRELFSFLSAPYTTDNSLLSIYLHEGDGKLRRLAARLLSLDGQPVPGEVSRLILGQSSYDALAPYLDFTRATYLDLLYLSPVPGEPPPCLAGIQKAETLCDYQLLREVISELGWDRMNFGLETERRVTVSVSGSFPLTMSPAEASFFEGVEDARRTGDHLLFIAHGGLPSDARKTRGENDVVSRFRSYNLTHSEVLADILDVAPLTRTKVDRILEKMDSIVSDFTTLFSAFAEECTILPDIYRELKDRIQSELSREASELQLSHELTRLVQMFEDPASLGSVRTLHGLKRYLHQRGLRLGFRLVESGRATNRTVTLVAATRNRIAHVTRDIQYADFGSEKNVVRLSQIPYSVMVVVEAFGRQILHGLHRLPSVKIFCYGNEVHYYLAFLNHPAFLRIDYSPPLRGGMIDLEYYGVSKFDLDMHPNISLDYIQQFFHQLEYDVRVEKTRVHARYDKERALSLGDICEKAEALFRLSPYLMDIDWTIGSLDLPDEGRQAVARAWSKFLALWGVLPIQYILGRDRRGILVAVESGTSGEKEITWAGVGPYRDRLTSPSPKGLFQKLRFHLAELGLEINPLFEESRNPELGQILLETLLFHPLRNALRQGEIFETPEGFRKSPSDIFQRKHETEFFAEILSCEEDETAASDSLAAIMSPIEGNYAIPLGPLHASFLLAHLAAPLERTLRFQTSGSLNGFEVQRASMALCGKSLGLYVLRDGAGIIRLALFSYGDSLYLRRKHADSPWQSNGSIDASEFAELLWLNNYLTSGMESVKTDACRDAEATLACFHRMNPLHRPSPIPGDNLIEGLKASPGRAVGKALFGTRGRMPEDFKDSILVAPSIRPEDNTFLYHSAGVVTIGGGILSHAGLIAVQFHKPALIISGQWQESAAGAPFLLYSTIEYREQEMHIRGYEITIRRDVHKRQRRLREEDLVVLDADEGILRVLGQDREVLSLHESFRQFGEASHQLAKSSDEWDILTYRGRRLRSRHQIEKHLTHLTEVLLAHHAVQELFIGKHLSDGDGGKNEKVRFLAILLANPAVGQHARDFILDISRNILNRYHDRSEEAGKRLSVSNSPYEILSLRLQTLHLCQALEDTSSSLVDCGFKPIEVDTTAAREISQLAYERLAFLRRDLVRSIHAAHSRQADNFRLRHMVRQVQRLDSVLDTPEADRAPIDDLKARIIANDDSARIRFSDRWVLSPDDGGFELFSLIGWKAANLAEVQRLGGSSLVPPWFVVTDRTFQEVLDSPLDRAIVSSDGFSADTRTVYDAITAILTRSDCNNLQKSRTIRHLWERIPVPAAIAREVSAAYRRLAEDVPEGPMQAATTEDPFVAIRSSGREEDTESATRAGEFDTFLYIRGVDAVLEYIKRAWSGLWTERAIHNRAVLGSDFQRAGGGIVVQRNAWSRVSGVLQTVNVAENKLMEIVINVGLGLGEGIVSGTVSADQVVVAKTDNLQEAPLRFRYITSDKREQVVFNDRVGYGTIRAQTLYHQRLRPALEYVELVELVRAADRLESAYGYPLDIEFGIEGTRLWILQARPVGTFPAILRETMQHYPLQGIQGQAALTANLPRR